MESKPKSKLNLSLLKIGNKKCPHCGHPVDAKRLYLGNHLWAKWLCPNCESLLTFDTRPRTIITVIFCSALIILLIVNLIGIQYFLPVLVLYAASLLFWESVKLLEPERAAEVTEKGEKDEKAEAPEKDV